MRFILNSDVDSRIIELELAELEYQRMVLQKQDFRDIDKAESLGISPWVWPVLVPEPPAIECKHEWVDTGFRKTWCKYCNEDKKQEHSHD